MEEILDFPMQKETIKMELNRLIDIRINDISEEITRLEKEKKGLEEFKGRVTQILKT